MNKLPLFMLPLLLWAHALFSTDLSLYYHQDALEPSACVINTFDAPHSSFKALCFDTHSVLEQATKAGLPTIIFIPASYHGLSPLDTKAPWLEGVRVAMTWASIFSKKAPVYLITSYVEPSQATHCQLVAPLASSPQKEGITLLKADSLLEQSLTKIQGTLRPAPTLLNACLKKRLIKPILKSPEPLKKRFLISGAIGFIGSHLTKALLDQGHQVIGLDNLSCCDPKNIEPFKGDPNFNFFYQDITQPIEVEGPIDYVIHLASVPSPAFYYTMPIETMTSGLYGTQNMLEVALQKKARFLFTSTSEVYGDPTVSPQPESYPGNVDPLGPRAPYDQSKRGAETLIKIYHEHYHMDVRIARLFNTYGPRMRLDDGRVITNFIQALLTTTPMTLYGSGTQTRSFSYVDDTVRGLLQLLEVKFPPATPIQERVFNIGTTYEVTIEELAHQCNTLATKLGIAPTEIKSIKAFDHSDPKQRRPDLARARHVLQYEPTIPLTDGLEKTLLHFLKKERK